MPHRNVIKTLKLIKCLNPERPKSEQMLLAKTTRYIVVWKKVHKDTKGTTYKIIPLVLPTNTLIVCQRFYYKLKTNKMRANQAISYGEGYSHWKLNFKYPNQTFIKPDRFSKLPKVCDHGIHFFLTEKEAENYDLS